MTKRKPAGPQVNKPNAAKRQAISESILTSADLVTLQQEYLDNLTSENLAQWNRAKARADQIAADGPQNEKDQKYYKDFLKRKKNYSKEAMDFKEQWHKNRGKRKAQRELDSMQQLEKAKEEQRKAKLAQLDEYQAQRQEKTLREKTLQALLRRQAVPIEQPRKPIDPLGGWY